MPLAGFCPDLSGISLDFSREIFFPVVFHDGNQSYPVPAGPHTLFIPWVSPQACTHLLHGVGLQVVPLSFQGRNGPWASAYGPGEGGFLLVGRPLPGTLVSLSSWLPAENLLGEIAGVISQCLV